MIIIPARLESVRFPNKVLLPLDGIPMVIWVARIGEAFDRVVVATDSKKVQAVCDQYNVQSILTSSTHQSGTDRIAECARILQVPNDELIINLQGDEPFLEPCVIESLRACMHAYRAKWGEFPFMGSCAKKITPKQASDCNLVKVVMDANKHALYFSRAQIPFKRDEGSMIQYFGHVGIYAFSAQSLQEFCILPHSLLEESEKLEQLRALEHGKTIIMAEVETNSFGIDTEADLLQAQRLFMRKNNE